MKNKNAKNLKRDRNILLSQQGLINMNTKSVKDMSKYSRKEKHKSERSEYSVRVKS